MADAVDYRDGIGRKDLQKIRRRFLGLHRERLRRIEAELRPGQRQFITLLPLLFHINHPMLPGFVTTQTPAGIADFTPSQSQLRAAKKISRSFAYRKRARRRYHIQGLYLMGSIGSIAHNAGSDLDIWLCHDPRLSSRAKTTLRAKVVSIEQWAKEQGFEAHIYLIDAEAFRRGELDQISYDSSGTTQHRLLLEEFYRTGVLLAGRYPLWWMVPPEQEPNYSEYAAMLLHKRFVNPLDCIDFGGLEKLPADEFFGAAHWQLFKGISSPYKSILKLLLTEAYSQDYPHIRWLCQEAKSAIYAGDFYLNDLDPYVLMYRRVEQYLLQRGEFKRLELARRCFYFKTELPLSKQQPRLEMSWQQTLLQRMTRQWGWGKKDLLLLDAREQWKIDRVLEERNTLVRELTHSYRLLTDFARAYAHSGRIDPQELSLLGRKLYTALEKRPGKIDSINPGISRSLMEERVSLHFREHQDEGSSWLLFLGEVNEEQALVTSPIKTTSGLIEMLTWCHLNRVMRTATRVTLYPEQGPVRVAELHALLSTLRNIYPDGSEVECDMEQLASPPHALSCTLFINTGTDPMKHLSRVGKQLTSNRSDPLSFGASHVSLVGKIEQLISTNWGETLVLSYQGSGGLLNSLCHYLKSTLSHHSPGPIPEVSAHCFSSVRATGIARRVQKLYNDVRHNFERQEGGTDRRYLLQADDEYYLIQRKREGFSYIALQTLEELLELLGENHNSFQALCVDDQALQETPFPAIFTRNRPAIIQLFYHTTRDTTLLYLLDEQGALFQQEMAATDEHYLLLQQQRFLDGIRLLRSLLAEEPAHRLLLDRPEFYRLDRDRKGLFFCTPRTPPRHRLPDSYLELRLVSDSLDLRQSPHLLICGDQEFSSFEYGDRLFPAVAEYILSQRRNQQSYPIYLTGLELSRTAGEGTGSTIDLFNLKKRLEGRLNHALNTLTQEAVGE